VILVTELPESHCCIVHPLLSALALESLRICFERLINAGCFMVDDVVDVCPKVSVPRVLIFRSQRVLSLQSNALSKKRVDGLQTAIIAPLNRHAALYDTPLSVLAEDHGEIGYFLVLYARGH